MEIVKIKIDELTPYEKKCKTASACYDGTSSKTDRKAVVKCLTQGQKSQELKREYEKYLKKL